jgi:hypothetical protein
VHPEKASNQDVFKLSTGMLARRSVKGGVRGGSSCRDCGSGGDQGGLGQPRPRPEAVDYQRGLDGDLLHAHR